MEKTTFGKIILWIMFLILLLGVAYGSFFILKMNKIENKISMDIHPNNISVMDTLRNLVSSNNVDLKTTTEGRINILLLGISGGERRSGENLTDTIMIASIDTKTNQVALLSIPRDLYVEVPDPIYGFPRVAFQTKINSVYEYGIKNASDKQSEIKPIKQVIENITSEDINYWVVLNFEGFKKIIDSIGGINIENKFDIYDPKYPGPNYSYETFELKKGLHLLDGETALKYARMRHNDPEGDFGRAKRQQQVMQAAKNKVFSTGTFLNVVMLNNLFDALGDNIKTNITHEEIGDFLNLLKKIDTNNINNVVVDAWNKDSLLKVSHVFYGETRAFVLIPRIGSWDEIQEVSKNIFNTNLLKKRREEISKENATVVLVNKSGKNSIIRRIENLLKESFEYKNVIILSDQNGGTEKTSFVYDFTNGQKPFTLDEITKKLSATFYPTPKENYQKMISGIDADIMLVIGEDLIERYSMELNTIEEYNKASD